MKIPTYYSEDYYAPTPTASMQKLPVVAKLAGAAGYADIIETSSTEGLMDKLKKIHNPEYVEAFMDGKLPLAESNGWTWTEQIRDGVLRINQGQLDAAKHALEYGFAANVAQGFHHARIESGAGFCTFNGLALVASEFPDKKVFVLDCDEHSGDGTSEFTSFMQNFAQATIHGSPFGMDDNDRSLSITLPCITSRFHLYMEALEEAMSFLCHFQPNLIIYQAGADPHIDDPLGSLGMTTSQMKERDEWVFRRLEALGIPAFFVLAGGYQKPIKQSLAPLHLNTFEAASRQYI